MPGSTTARPRSRSASSGPNTPATTGIRSASADELNEAGQAVGLSDRYNGGSTNLGASAWLYNGATTIDIGLTGAEHTRNDGYKYSQYGLAELRNLNDAGQVIGYSARYNGGPPPWAAVPGCTTA